MKNLKVQTIHGCVKIVRVGSHYVIGVLLHEDRTIFYRGSPVLVRVNKQWGINPEITLKRNWWNPQKPFADYGTTQRHKPEDIPVTLSGYKLHLYRRGAACQRVLIN